MNLRMQTRYFHFGERHHHNHISLLTCKESGSFFYTKHLDFELCGPYQPYLFTQKLDYFVLYCIRHKLDKVA